MESAAEHGLCYLKAHSKHQLMARQRGMSLAFGNGSEYIVATVPAHQLSVVYLFRQLLAGSGVLTMLQQSIQDLIQIKRTFHQNDNVSVDFAGAKLQVSASAFHAIHYLATYEPAVSACQGALEPFRASFIHAVHVAMGQALQDLEAGFELRSHMPQSLYIMLNTGRFLDNSLTNFISALSGKK
ncbi:hypothetical protein MRX96_010222 [Rhipicephalus microplus]